MDAQNEMIGRPCCHPEYLPRVKVGDILNIYHADKPHNNIFLRVNGIGAVKGNMQLSISKYIASVIDLTARKEVIVENALPENASLTYVEVLFKDQYVGRSDMYRLRSSLKNQCTYVGKKIVFSSVRGMMYDMIGSSGRMVKSGLITNNTRFIFRSRSARMFVFFQLSAEMWEFAPDGDLYFEKAIKKFLRDIFARWKDNTNHAVTIIFFSRVFYPEEHLLEDDPCYSFEDDGRPYKDFFRVVLDEIRNEWESTIVLLKKHFQQWPNLIEWTPPNLPLRNPGERLKGTNSLAKQGNFLEAINLALSIFERHYIDRDLQRTGQLIVMLSPGSGVFEVDSELTRMTKGKMIELGIGCDLICLTNPPFHRIPLFKYKDKQNEHAFDIPHWIHTSFITDSSAASHPRYLALSEDTSQGPFIPCCNLKGIESIMPEETKVFAIPREIRPIPSPIEMKFSQAHFTAYDERVFNSNKMTAAEYSQLEENTMTPDLPIVGSYSLAPSSSFDNVEEENVMMGSAERERSTTLGRTSSITMTTPPSLAKSRRSLAPSHSEFSMSTADMLSLAKGQKPKRKKYEAFARSNPFKISTQLPKNSTSGRWSHFVAAGGMITYANTFPYPPNWRSLMEPASLPLTTDYLPEAADLKTNYTEHVYQLSSSGDENAVSPSTIDCLKELVCQRLGQGFQLYKNDEETETSNKMIYHLGLGHNFHQVGYDRASQNIELKRYQRKYVPQSEPFSYKYALIPVNQDEVVIKKVQLGYYFKSSYPWNSLDTFICGYEDPTEDMKHWRIRYGLLPASSLIAKKGSTSNLTSSKEKPASLSQSPSLSSSLNRSIGGIDLDSPTQVQDINANFLKWKSQLLTGLVSKTNTTLINHMNVTVSVPKPEAPSSEYSSLAASGDYSIDPSQKSHILAAMRDKESGFSIADRKYRLKTYKQCFIGSDAVSWVLNRVSVTSREDAVKFLQNLLDEGVIEHAAGDKKEFIDGSYFYRLKETGEPPRVPLIQKPRKSKSSDAIPTILLMRSDPNAPNAIPVSTSNLNSTSNFVDENTIELGDGDDTLILDKVIRVDIDKDKTDRAERITLKYDSVFNYQRGWHMEINWQVATGCIIDDFIVALQRKAKLAGFSLVQIPVNPWAKNSFAESTFVRCTKTDDEIKHILTKCEFLYDFPGGNYIHRSGLVLLRGVQEGFECYLNPVGWAKNHSSAAVQILREFSIACNPQYERSLSQDLTSAIPPMPSTPLTPSASKKSTSNGSITPREGLVKSDEGKKVKPIENWNLDDYYLTLRNST
eukprot:TRINITY_DN2275_c0_g1_i3.p1 TRINITY_DN2275_c0_g1~~TRINITY_DN2275_c0_g1_i3.p1  ORF type:complete len:1283 (+),score=361.19 TRINITY_DN2275_c0_g1_i3:3701-7549(+)